MFILCTRPHSTRAPGAICIHFVCIFACKLHANLHANCIRHACKFACKNACKNAYKMYANSHAICVKFARDLHRICNFMFVRFERSTHWGRVWVYISVDNDAFGTRFQSKTHVSVRIFYLRARVLSLNFSATVKSCFLEWKRVPNASLSTEMYTQTRPQWVNR